MVGYQMLLPMAQAVEVLEVLAVTVRNVLSAQVPQHEEWAQRVLVGLSILFFHHHWSPQSQNKQTLKGTQ